MSEESNGTERRQFLRGVAGTTLAGGLATILPERDIVQPVRATGDGESALEIDSAVDTGDVFPQSVMSGGPTTSGVILWTRIAPGAHSSGQDLGVEVATDSEFSDIVHSGTVAASEITPDHDYTVKVDLDGELSADQFYHYRFVYDGTPSQTGRCRTLPEPSQSVDSLSFAIVNCQDYLNGYYGAFHHVAQEDVDYLLHLGDIIYESVNGYNQPSKDPSNIAEGREIDLPSGAGKAETLEDYRKLYNTYKQDRFFQEALEQHTILLSWDDHEVADNRYWSYENDAPVLPHREQGHDPEFALRVTANAIQTWIEQVPARVEYDPSQESLHDQLQIWRDFQFGDLMNLSITDERLFRHGTPSETGESAGAQHRTILGDEQKSWFLDHLEGNPGLWTVWGNAVLTMPLNLGWTGTSATYDLNEDAWDGYTAERQEIMQHVGDHVDNFITLTGDMHSGIAGFQKDDYSAWYWDDEAYVGVEFMAPAITSLNAAGKLDFSNQFTKHSANYAMSSANSHIEYFNAFDHGYVVFQADRQSITYTIYAVDKDDNSADASREQIKQFSVPEGEVDIRGEWS